MSRPHLKQMMRLTLMQAEILAFRQGLRVMLSEDQEVYGRLFREPPVPAGAVGVVVSVSMEPYAVAVAFPDGRTIYIDPYKLEPVTDA